MDVSTVLNAVKNVNGASFIGIDTVTTPKLLGGRKNPHQGRVTKKIIGASVMAFQNKKSNGYERMVQRRLEAEGKNPQSFELGPRAWGTRVADLPIVEHTKDGVTKYYLEVIFLNAGEVKYFLDGVEVPANTIQGLEASEEGSQGGLDNKVVIRTFAVDSIEQLRINGTKFS